MKQQYLENGYFLMEGVFAPDQVAALKKELSAFDGKINNYGVRGLIGKVPCIKILALSSPLVDIARQVLGEDSRPVRSILFDKVEGANWNVAWHQDTSIALKEKHEIPGFGSWSEKQGVVHAEPPEIYLKNTLTLRVHLDRANSDTGVLRVVPGTHVKGRVHSTKILEIVNTSPAIECNANEGDVLLMNPLLFHSSRKAINPTHRRVIHIEYSAMGLPSPLQWHECA